MHRPAEMVLWSGRVDSDPLGNSRRWHQLVISLGDPEQVPGIALLGLACDEGVRRNQGRTGAAKGADAIRRALAPLALHSNRPVYDAGNLQCELDDLESLQQEQASWVRKLLDLGHFPLLLGGGHEIAFGSFLGLERHLVGASKEAPIGIINFDSHFDLRSDHIANSGTPFRQIADYCQEQSIPFHYLCLGVSEAANTAALFARAEGLGVSYLKDEELGVWQLAQAEQRLLDFIQPCRALYLSIDLDVLPAATAPGVSAPAARGVSMAVLEYLLKLIRSQAGERLRVADIAEYNPRFDIDQRTAKVAARLCHLLTR